VSELIFVEVKPMAGKEYVPQTGTSIGREGCDINIADPEVSRRHATLHSEGGVVTIEDLESTNGTFVNGERITGKRQLAEGDEVRLGATVWKLQAAPQATAAEGTGPSTAAPPQVTTARQIPVEPPTEQQAAAEPPKPPSPPPPVPGGAPAAGAPTPPAAGGPGAPTGKRGDVPAPDFAPSAIRRVVPPPGGPTVFDPGPPDRRRGSAATRVGATVFALIAVALTAAGVIAYYLVEPFADDAAGGGGEPAAVIQEYSAAIADGDGGDACDRLTEDAQEQIADEAEGDGSCEEVIELVSGFLNDEQKDDLRDIEPTDVEIDGDTATATVPEVGEQGQEEEVELVREDGDWRISNPGD
jgi:hypothetical protein